MERARLWVSIVDRGLTILDDEDRLVLDRFYIRPGRGAAERLAGDLHIDIKSVYRRKDKALHKFTVALYGGTES